MPNRVFKILIFMLFCASATTVFAQSSPPQVSQGQQPPKAPKAAKPEKAPGPAAPSVYAQDQVPVESVNVKLAKGGKVAISSRAGQIIVRGWDGDTVQASATGDNGPVPIETQTTGDPSRPRLLLSLSGRRIGRGEARLDVRYLVMPISKRWKATGVTSRFRTSMELQ